MPDRSFQKSAARCPHRFLLVRLSSLGDVVHAVPAASGLRDAFPEAQIDWVIDARWQRLLEGNPDLNEVIVYDRRKSGGLSSSIRKLRAARYTCAIDFQGLYKSALLALASGAPRRIGFQSSYAREGLVSMLYTDHVNPRGPHKVDHNRTLVERAGAHLAAPRFPLAIRPEDDELVVRELQSRSITDFYVLNPGGGWVSKCWPAERYGELHRQLATRHGWRGVVTVGPGEENLARDLIRAAGDSAPVAIPLALGPLMALLRRAKLIVSGDTGPLHLASALGTPVVGLFGPTDPARNGPFSPGDISVRNPRHSITTYARGASYSPAMLSITIDQVVDAVERRMGRIDTGLL
ncbi:MAG TPA: glycosyltransferase family 9 protein [Candidatus Acidoferrales bacterium]|nr:glycosyltransferase family 9 protein [Candidatus Acidoferrales bacterium]